MVKTTKKRKNVHVVHHKDGDSWHVKYEKQKEPLAIFDTQEEAILNGVQMAMDQMSELIIHREDGVITAKQSFKEAKCAQKS